jgi:TrmH family RNA methyltransferase
MIALKDFKPYKKQFGFSYAFGPFPTIELLNTRPKEALAVLYSKDAIKSSAFSELKEKCERNNIPLILTERVFGLAKNESISLIGVFKKYQASLSADDSHIILVRPDDMGNIGAILRSMAGFDYANLALIGNAADFYNPKTVRASMGSIFRVNIQSFRDIGEYLKVFPKHKLYSFMLSGKKTLSDTKFAGLHGLIFGNEGEGLPKEYEKISQPIRIEQSKNIDSLNLSVAASLAMFHNYKK